MLDAEFVAMLTDVTDDTVVWRQTIYGNTYFNQGYPTIQGRYLYQRAQNLLDNMTVSGVMHRSLCLSSAALSADSEEYTAMAQKGELLAAYSFASTDENGGYVPSELWNAGSYRLTIPTNGKDIMLIVENYEGEIMTVDPDTVSDGVATFSVGGVTCFAVAKAAPLLGDVDGNGRVSILDATAIQRVLADLPVEAYDASAADANGDGTVNILDATYIQRWLAGLSSNENIGQPIA